MFFEKIVICQITEMEDVIFEKFKTQKAQLSFLSIFAPIKANP